MPLKTLAYDSAAVLDSAEAIEEYLLAAFETEDPAFIAASLGVVAKARGMTALAAETGLTRQTLYKALSAEGNPELGTVIKVAHALGYRLTPERLAEPA